MLGTRVEISSKYSFCINSTVLASFILGVDGANTDWLLRTNSFVVEYSGGSLLGEGMELPLRLQPFPMGNKACREADLEAIIIS